ncbi:MAG: histidine phosphatase family protein [Alphaproteobacteria bacterium]|nr:histidine phosphatase family protein [Alphaproteobacteria bacterium]
MKTLYLLRHADAEKNPTISDIDRSLTNHGVEEVAELAQKMQSKEINFDTALCSTAKRTIQTCDLLLENINKKPNTKNVDALYNPSIKDFIKTISTIDEDTQSVLVVSHNPTISEVANLLSHSSSHFVSFSPANLAKIELDIENWKSINEGCGKISWFL